MSTEIIAFAATAGNQLGADPGIEITEYDNAGDVHVTLEYIDGDPGEDEDGDLDEDSAGAILESRGWVLAGAWTLSNGQWAVEVERASA